MKRWKLNWTFIVVIISWTFLSMNESRGDLLQNMEFETDIAGWAIGAVDPLGTWDVQWSADHGGSAKMYISGGPAHISITQETQIAIMPGDQLTINVFHTNMGNFGRWVLKLDGSDILDAVVRSEGYESLTWTADRYYGPGTVIYVGCVVWPGTSTTWVDSLVYTPKLFVTYPIGGEELLAGATCNIEWVDIDGIDNVSIEYSDANSLNWTVIDPNTPNDGEYDWTLPEVTSNQCLVRISDVDDPNINDVSDDLFTIYQCQLSSIGQDADLDDNCKIDIVDFSIWLLQWLKNGNPFDVGYTEPLPIMWVYIDDSGAEMKDDTGNPISHGGFTGYMSKYETTNAQYCQFLSAAFASGDITVDANDVMGANGSNSGADFLGEVYYNLAGPGYTNSEATNGGAARINYSSGVFTVDSGFEDHPVTYVSWNGATAFCNYYGYRLPTEWEWQAVADYDGSFIYGCGPSLNNSIANYRESTHPDGTAVVGSFGDPNGYGYGMCDMAGNAWEWTSTVSGSSSIIRGSGWNSHDCTVSFRYNLNLSNTASDQGFRVCR